MSEAKTIGSKLVALCKEGKNMEAVQELYADDVVSVEAASFGDMGREAKGKQAVMGKGSWWYDNHEVHSTTTEGPFEHGDDKFAVLFEVDCTFKPESKRTTMREIGIYTVAGGKIVREEFFYPLG